MHPRDQDREFAAVRNGLVVTAALCVVELVGGWFTNSLALVSDAAHLFADVAALAPPLFALSDVLGSAGAVAAGVVIIGTGWNGADAVASAVIAVLILFSSWTLVREAVDVLMEAVPAHVDVESLRRSLERVPGTEEVHDLHVWSLTTGRYALSAHAVVTGDHDHDADDAILAA